MFENQIPAAISTTLAYKSIESETSCSLVRRILFTLTECFFISIFFRTWVEYFAQLLLLLLWELGWHRWWRATRFRFIKPEMVTVVTQMGL